MVAHDPQLLESTLRSAHSPPHKATMSAPEGEQEHFPFVQSAPGGHCMPQVPQLLGSLSVLTQVIVPFTGHMAVAPAQPHPPMGFWQPTPASHNVSQLPQLVGS